MVEVYYNLHKLKWSVRTTKPSRVISHCRHIHFPNGGSFVVRNGGRKRVLYEKRKNVHAFVRGLGFYETLPLDFDPDGCIGITYNPYKHLSFIDISNNVPILSTTNPIIMIAEHGCAPRVWIRKP